MQPLSVLALLAPSEVNLSAYAGKAGGFLALDWQDGGATGPLGRLSFKLHQELADSLGKDIGYRRVQTLSAAAAPAKKGQPRQITQHILLICCSASGIFCSIDSFDEHSQQTAPF